MIALYILKPIIIPQLLSHSISAKSTMILMSREFDPFTEVSLFPDDTGEGEKNLIHKLSFSEILQ